MKNITVVFVVLHYMLEDVTVQCVNSIVDKITYEDYKIVIVDNGSLNNSGKNLIDYFEDNRNIVVLLLDNNLGFSAGNNVGYKYAKESLAAQFIVVLNNDTEIIQRDFVDLLINIYQNSHYFVLGPDIINLMGIHQSPQRDHIITQFELYLWYVKRKLFLILLKIIKEILLIQKVLRVKDTLNTGKIFGLYEKHDGKRRKLFDYIHIKENVELQGACFIFSPDYISNNAKAFDELSFMYGEEPALARRCYKNNWKILYNPNIKIKHYEQVSVKKKSENLLDKEIFYTKNLVYALRNIIKNL